MARSTPPPPPAGPGDHGTVHPIEAARRRRSHRSAPGDAIRVIVVSSHALTRAGLRSLLERDSGLTVVGEVEDASECGRLVRATGPDVVVLDVGLLAPDPAAATRFLARRVPVLLLTECESDERLLDALRAGATGLLPKDSHPAQLASAVRTLAGGGALLPPRTTRRLITELVNTPSPAPR